LLQPMFIAITTSDTSSEASSPRTIERDSVPTEVRHAA
jgi:hypothetical protein